MAPPLPHLLESSTSTSSQVQGRLPVLARDVHEVPGRLVPGADRVQVHGAAVAQEHARRAVDGIGDVDLVPLAVTAEVGQRVDHEDARLRAEAVQVELRRGEARGARAHDHAVEGLARALDAPRAPPDPGAALDRVDVVGVRDRPPVDPHRALDDLVGDARPLALELGRVVLLGERLRRAHALRLLLARLRPERRLGAGYLRRGGRDREPGGADRRPVEEVTAPDAVRPDLPLFLVGNRRILPFLGVGHGDSLLLREPSAARRADPCARNGEHVLRSGRRQ